MWFCNSCNIELMNTSKSIHLKSKKHSNNSKIIPYNESPPVYAKDLSNTLYKTYPDIYVCSFCGETNKSRFYENNHSSCKVCKCKRSREKHPRQYY